MPERNPQDKDGPGDHGRLSSELEEQISVNLRKLYQSTIDEELPERLRDLLERLKAQDRQDD